MFTPFVVGLLLLTSCQPETLVVGPAPQPWVQPEPPARTHPPILFEAFAIRSGTVPATRPLLHGQYLVQQFSVDKVIASPGREWSGIVRYNMLNSHVDTITAATGAVNYSTSRINGKGIGIFEYQVPAMIRVVDVVGGRSVAAIDVPTPSSAVTQDGEIALYPREVDGGTKIEVNLFNPATLTFSPLFNIPRLKGGQGDWSVVTTIETYADSVGTHVYGVVGHYERSDDSAPCYAFAYNLTTRELEWISKFPPELQASNAQRLAVDEHNVYQKSWFRVVAYDRITGKERWRYDAQGEPIGQSPLMTGGGRVYFLTDVAQTAGTGTYGLDAMSGTMTYYNPSVGGTSVAAERYRNLYALTSSGNGAHKIYLFDPETGVYLTEWESPNCGTTGNCSFFVEHFSVDEAGGRLAAHDYNYIYVFDISAYGRM